VTCVWGQAFAAASTALSRREPRIVALRFHAHRGEEQYLDSGLPSIVDAHLDHLSEADRDKVKGGNLAALLGFD